LYFKQITLSGFISELSFWSCVLLKRDGRNVAVVDMLTNLCGTFFKIKTMAKDDIKKVFDIDGNM
jgi:hypothetical protein